MGGGCVSVCVCGGLGGKTWIKQPTPTPTQDSNRSDYCHVGKKCWGGNLVYLMNYVIRQVINWARNPFLTSFFVFCNPIGWLKFWNCFGFQSSFKSTAEARVGGKHCFMGQTQPRNSNVVMLNYVVFQDLFWPPFNRPKTQPGTEEWAFIFYFFVLVLSIYMDIHI